MASVFLSYDHDDADRARRFAQAFERAGHKVWWDLHVRGGSQFSNVIEEALKSAEVVVVLWSSNSVESAWVRDEAAAGRDSGRLIPVSLDRVKPPLGFRQYQTIDLSNWKGRGKPAQLLTLLADLDAMTPRRGVAIPKTDRSLQTATGWSTSRRLRLAGLTMGAIIVVIAVAILWRPWASDASTRVAISPADTSPASQSYARDLLAQLGQLQSAKPDMLQLIAPKDRKRASLVFELSGVVEGRRARANLLLLDGKSENLLWSSAFERPLDEASDLHQQLGYTAAQVLECAAEARPGGRSVISADALKLYLNACAAFADKTPENLQPLVSMFLHLTRLAPRFADGWAKLLLAESEYTRTTFVPEAAGVLAALPAHIAAARELDPNMPEAFLAEGALLPDMEFERRIGLFQRALENDPANAEILSFLSDQYRFVGRINESVDVAQRAVQANPLSPTVRNSLVSALTYAGKTEAALAELKKLEQIWPGASNVRFARFVVDLRYGDPNEAMRSIRSGEVNVSQTPYVESFLRARIDPTPGNVDRAVEDARSWYEQEPTTIYHFVQVLGTFGRDEELFSILLNWPHPDKVIVVADGLFRPALRNIHRDPRMIAVAKRLGLLDYWQETGKWPDFCFEQDLPYGCKKEAAKLAA